MVEKYPDSKHLDYPDGHPQKKIRELQAELAELQEIFTVTQQQDTDSCRRVGELMEENKGLREALNRIANASYREIVSCCIPTRDHPAGCNNCPQCCANAALAVMELDR